MIGTPVCTWAMTRTARNPATAATSPISMATIASTAFWRLDRWPALTGSGRSAEAPAAPAHGGGGRAGGGAQSAGAADRPGAGAGVAVNGTAGGGRSCGDPIGDPVDPGNGRANPGDGRASPGGGRTDPGDPAVEPGDPAVGPGGCGADLGESGAGPGGGSRWLTNRPVSEARCTSAW